MRLVFIRNALLCYARDLEPISWLKSPLACTAVPADACRLDLDALGADGADGDPFDAAQAVSFALRLLGVSAASVAGNELKLVRGCAGVVPCSSCIACVRCPLVCRVAGFVGCSVRALTRSCLHD
jgi:hypothetical protein